jgi:hypothetical protein
MFDGFPYLVTRLVAAFYHLIALPRWKDAELLDVARAQAVANHLDTCLVLGPARALFLSAGGEVHVSEQPPSGGAVVAGKLAPSVDFEPEPDLVARVRDLHDFVERRGLRHGFLFGDLTKGGRPATPEELRQLQGINDHGVPRGLERCDRCGAWYGVCLDPSENFRGQLMRVHCHCQNQNRCARCGEHLYEWRLNANYYEPTDNSIWHVPAFSGLSHRCGTGPIGSGSR